MSTAPRTGKRRAEDQLVVPMFIAGCGCILIASAIAGAFFLTKTPFTVMGVIVIGFFAVGGLLLMPTHRVLMAIRWFHKNGGAKPTP